MSSSVKPAAPVQPVKGKVYAKIGVYCGLVAPMHWHAPYTYWQWPWERHTKAGADHDLHDVSNPIWVDAKTSDPTKTGVKLYKPTAAEVKRYNAALKAPEKEIVEGYKAYIKAKKAGGTVMTEAQATAAMTASVLGEA